MVNIFHHSTAQAASQPVCETSALTTFLFPSSLFPFHSIVHSLSVRMWCLLMLVFSYSYSGSCWNVDGKTGYSSYTQTTYSYAEIEIKNPVNCQVEQKGYTLSERECIYRIHTYMKQTQSTNNVNMGNLVEHNFIDTSMLHCRFLCRLQTHFSFFFCFAIVVVWLASPLRVYRPSSPLTPPTPTPSPSCISICWTFTYLVKL